MQVSVSISIKRIAIVILEPIYVQGKQHKEQEKYNNINSILDHQIGLFLCVDY